MERSPFFAGWSSCPRCAHEIDIEASRASCRNCGLDVHANPAPTASALLLDGEGRVLLARRAGDPGQGCWDIVGGFMEEGEDPLETLRREVREETGLEVEPLDFLGGYPDRYGAGGVYTINFYWTARVGPGDPEPADDVAELAWFEPDGLPGPAEFAFENTVRVLRDWTAGVRTAGPAR